MFFEGADAGATVVLVPSAGARASADAMVVV